MNEFGEYLKELRGNRSLREMERITGLSHTYLSTLEKGVDPRSGNERKPTPDVIRKIADGLGVSYYALMEKAGYYDRNTQLLIELRNLLLKKATSESELRTVDEKLEKIINGMEPSEKSERAKLTEYKHFLETDLEKTNSFISILKSEAHQHKIHIDEIENEFNFNTNMLGNEIESHGPIDLKFFLASNIEIEINGKLLNQDEKHKLLKIAETMFSEELK